MKSTVVILALLLAVMLTAGGYDSPVSEQSVDGILGSNFVGSNKLTSEIVPMIAVSIDDGRDDLVCMAPGVATNPGDQGYRGMYWPFLVNRIPVTLSLNYDILGSPGRATVADIQRIIAEFDSAGVPIEIAQHSNNNFNGSAGFVYQDIVDEIDVTNLETSFGVEVQCFNIPGDGATFIRDNFWEVRKIMIAQGLKYANIMYDGVNKQGRVPNWFQGSNYKNVAGTDPVNLGDVADRAVFPGCSDDPYMMPAVKSFDLGLLYTERDPAKDGILPARYDSWTVLADGDGTPTDGDWVKTTRWYLNMMIANGWGMTAAIHDSLTSLTAATYPAGPGQGAYDGQWSPHAFVAQIKMYVDAGLLRAGTMSQLMDWGMSKYAPGTNLLPENWHTIPAAVVADTAGINYGWLPGCGAKGGTSAVWTANLNSDWTNTEHINGVFKRDGAESPFAFTGDNVSGYRGRTGGVQTVASNNDAIVIERTNLPLGRYLLTFNVDCDYAFVREFSVGVGGTIGWLNRQSPNLSYDYGDTLFPTFYNSLSGHYLVNNSGGVLDRNFSLPFYADPSVTAGWSGFTNTSLVQVGMLYGGFRVELESGTSRTCNWDGMELLYLGR